jgi:protein-tyrosine phosphatase
MNRPYRILFVCMGNICRSPAGEGVLQHFIDAQDLGERVACDSAGTIGYHAGNPADRRMSAAAARRGYRLTSRARQITRADLDAFDLILTMDEENHAHVRALARNPEEAARIRRFCDFVTAFPDREVPDPYYGGAQGFEHVLDLLEDGCRRVLAHALEDRAAEA